MTPPPPDPSPPGHAAEEDDQDTTAPDDPGSDARDPVGADEPGAPGDDWPGGDAGGQRRAVTVAGPGRRPPPRRTGVFLDADDLRAHVGDLLRSILGGYEVDGFGNFSFTHDGARVFVTIGATPVGLAVNVHCVTNIDLDLDEGLARFLATTNHRLGFGALSYDTDNRAVWLRHTLLGTTLDAPELQAAVATVANTAASIDDEVHQRFGGRTFVEAPADMRAATTPPRGRPTPAEHGDDSATDTDTTNASGYL